MHSFLIKGTRTPHTLGSKAPLGVCPPVPQLPVSWLGPNATSPTKSDTRDTSTLGLFAIKIASFIKKAQLHQIEAIIFNTTSARGKKYSFYAQDIKNLAKNSLKIHYTGYENTLQSLIKILFLPEEEIEKLEAILDLVVKQWGRMIAMVNKIVKVFYAVLNREEKFIEELSASPTVKSFSLRGNHA